jgi:hypothetical protein
LDAGSKSVPVIVVDLGQVRHDFPIVERQTGIVVFPCVRLDGSTNSAPPGTRAVAPAEAAKPLNDMMSLDEYMNFAEVWDKMPGENSCPFEPKASDWGWFEGRMVALYHLAYTA